MLFQPLAVRNSESVLWTVLSKDEGNNTKQIKPPGKTKGPLKSFIGYFLYRIRIIVVLSVQ